MRMALQHNAAMSQRITNIMHAVQPLREQQYQYYHEGKYLEAVNICVDAISRYVYYIADNSALCDMEILAGDCAFKIGAYEMAIVLYNKAKSVNVSGMDNKLSSIYYIKMNDARNSYRKGDYKSLWNDVDIALKTGWESGECYYYKGVCFENAGNYSNRDRIRYAKNMYKLAKKKKYAPASAALKALKNKKK